MKKAGLLLAILAVSTVAANPSGGTDPRGDEWAGISQYPVRADMSEDCANPGIDVVASHVESNATHVTARLELADLATLPSCFGESLTNAAPFRELRLVGQAGTAWENYIVRMVLGYSSCSLYAPPSPRGDLACDTSVSGNIAEWTFALVGETTHGTHPSRSYDIRGGEFTFSATTWGWGCPVEDWPTPPPVFHGSCVYFRDHGARGSVTV